MLQQSLLVEGRASFANYANLVNPQTGTWKPSGIRWQFHFLRVVHAGIVGTVLAFGLTRFNFPGAPCFPAWPLCKSLFRRS
jgi:hypothetical protein